MRIILNIAAITVAAALAGCTTTGADSRLSDQTSFFKNSNVQACLAGAAVVALLDRLRSSADTTSTLIAAGAGCATALAANSYLQSKREQHADTQTRIASEIEDVRTDNQQLSSLISTTKTIVAEDKAEIDAVKAKYAADQITRDEAIEQLAVVDANRRELNGVLTELESRQAEWEKVAAAEREVGGDTRALDAEIERMETNIATLQDEVDELNEYRMIAPVG